MLRRAAIRRIATSPIVLEGGFDADGTFVYLPFSGLEKMTEYFRRSVVRFFTEKKLLTEQFAQNLLSWRHSGFSIDNSVRILDESSRENLAQYIARPPVSLKKIHYEGFKGRVLFHTHYNEYFKENVHMFNACDFLAELTQHIPPKGVQLIRRYGLYSSRTKGAWESMPHVAERAPEGWRRRHDSKAVPSTPNGFGSSDDAALPDDSPDARVYRRAWARLLSKVYEINPMVCPKCGSEMKVVAVIQKPAEIDRILRHLVNQGRPPPGFDPASLN
ncbi:transposase [Marispirochaeta sp.]|uniref:transposase n=1 Tax=Marispirochaeta sp. TaxID=2038653 RepID=UPI0029C77497|nr:transposase [Marispirochaeta sp.]